MIPRTDERPNTIGLKWSGFYEEGRVASDDAAPPAPGHLLEVLTTESGVPSYPIIVKKHSSAGAGGVVRVALEDLLGNVAGMSRGRMITDVYKSKTTDATLPDDYGDIVPFVIPKSGDVLLLRAVAAAYTQGAALKSNGDGTVVAQGGTGTIIGEAEENRTTTSGDPFLRVRIA